MDWTRIWRDNDHLDFYREDAAAEAWDVAITDFQEGRLNHIQRERWRGGFTCGISVMRRSPDGTEHVHCSWDLTPAPTSIHAP